LGKKRTFLMNMNMMRVTKVQEKGRMLLD